MTKKKSTDLHARRDIIIGDQNNYYQLPDEKELEEIAALRAAQRLRFERECREWGSWYIPEEGSALPLDVSPYQDGRLGERQKLPDVVRQTTRLLVLGEPGAGKTVAMQQLALELCQGDGLTTPVWVRLSLYGEQDISGNIYTLDDLIRTALSLDKTDMPGRLLRYAQVRFFFLFDGLNEVTPARQTGLYVELVNWLEKYPGHPMILTSRVQDELWRKLRDTTPQIIHSVMLIQPIRDEQAQEYLRAHLGDKGLELYAGLDNRLRELARNPLLLMLIKEAGKHDETVPGNRGELYDRYVQRMLSRDLKRKVGTALKNNAKLRALAGLAYHLSREYRVDCRRPEAVKAVAASLGTKVGAAEGMVDVCARHGLLSGDGVWVEEDFALPGTNDFLRFAPHQTVQEHFTARALQAMLPPSSANSLWRWWQRRRAGSKWAKLARDDRWMEIFIQLAGLVDNPDWLAQQIVEKNPWLALWCVEQGGDVSQQTKLLVESRSERLLVSANIYDRRSAVQALARLKSERTLKPLWEAAADDDPETANLAAQALAGMGEVVQDLVKQALHGKDQRLWQAALRCLVARSDNLLCSMVPGEAWEALLGQPVVWIPAGSFLMGSDKSRNPEADDDELPQHELTLPGYWIGRYPVTAAQWRSFVNESGHVPQNETSLMDPDDRPVRFVNWHEAMAYCKWLSLRAGVPVTLPSEAQWEKAARGVNGRIYSRDVFFDPKEFNSRKAHLLIAITEGTRSSMHGYDAMAYNVWEWTSSLYLQYPYDPQKAERGNRYAKRVVRGGSLGDIHIATRCADRDGFMPDNCDYNLGFRLVCPAL